MDIEQLVSDFLSEDPQLFLPVLAGLVIILGGLIIGIFRGMTAGVIIALLFGGLMSMSPILLDSLERTNARVNTVSAEVAQGAAQLSLLNSEVVTDLTRVVTTMRTALEGLGPLITPSGGAESTGGDPQVAQRFSQTLSDTEERLDIAIAAIDRVNAVKQRLQSNMAALEVEMQRASATATATR